MLDHVKTVIELNFKYFYRLSELGQHVGARILDVLVLREKGLKREVRVLNILLFIKSVLWKVRHYGMTLGLKWAKKIPKLKKSIHRFKVISKTMPSSSPISFLLFF